MCMKKKKKKTRRAHKGEIVMFNEFDFVRFMVEGQEYVGTVYVKYVDDLYNEDGDLVAEDEDWYKIAIENEDGSLGRVMIAHESDIIEIIEAC